MANQKAPKKSLSVLLKLWAFMRPYKWTLVGASIALIFTAAITLSIGQGVRLLVDDGLVANSLDGLSDTVQLVFLLSLLMAVGTYARFYLVSWLGERVTADLRSAVFSHLVSLHPSYFEENRSGEIMSRLTTDTSLLQNIIGSSFSMALRSALTFVGSLILLLYTNLKLSLLVLVGVPLVLLPILMFGRRVRKLSRASQDSIADVGSYAGEIVRNIKTVQGFTRENYERAAFDKEVELAFSVARKRIRQRALLIATVILLVFVAISSLIWVGGSDMLAGAMTGGELAAFIFYALMMAGAVATISEVYGELQRAVGATERLLELLSVESLIPYQSGTDMFPASNASVIQFDGVTFSYPARPQVKALDQVSFSIREGERVALVGPSGAGKSTIFELLQRFYDINEGCVSVFGQSVHDVSTEALRKRLGIVSQQPVMFSSTIKHNIAYGNEDASQKDIEAAALAAHAHEFIEALPKGYDSYLGEQGTRLSGGQKQRVAIARAVLKDPDILLLDEATSALDSESEYHVQQAIDELTENRTTLIIAHRLSTIKHVDRILVFDQGQIVAQGTHDQLLASSELYSRLAKLQFMDA
ncbi:ABC transporter ATP-binding protein [Oleiphilus sp. HI0125]|uniref:ABC transporter transmembrane domain-containing protein n=3 Tax=unclassified Oleiphilus TaxID=2631174 RepID=UPI0007C25F9C|nr:ABC transporter transmembrane domain-containing protein [Oleiphilus sp. HI0125]KZZ58838.1 ABC transporter ATP-binding protein [Oleiphilus sp. HI0125]